MGGTHSGSPCDCLFGLFHEPLACRFVRFAVTITTHPSITGAGGVAAFLNAERAGAVVRLHPPRETSASQDRNGLTEQPPSLSRHNKKPRLERG